MKQLLRFSPENIYDPAFRLVKLRRAKAERSTPEPARLPAMALNPQPQTPSTARP